MLNQQDKNRDWTCTLKRLEP